MFRWIRGFVLLAGALAALAFVSDARAGEEETFAIRRLPVGKTAPGRKLGVLTYAVYELESGAWRPHGKQTVLFGDCPECTRGVVLSCVSKAAKSECKRSLGEGIQVRIDGDRYDRLGLTIKNNTRLRPGRPQGNTSWPIELVLYESVERPDAERAGAKFDPEPGVAKVEQANERREVYKLVLNVSQSKTKPVTDRPRR